MGAPICPDCNKFCSLETGEPEVTSFDVNPRQGGGDIEAEVRLVRESLCCGAEVKEYNYQIGPVEFDHNCARQHMGQDVEYDFEEPDFEADESGGGRYQKNMISVAGTAELECSLCKATIEVELKDEAAASWFDELY